MYQIFLDCQRDGIDYNLAYIPKAFELKPNEDVDPVNMGKLFDLGYQSAGDGFQWYKASPVFE
ncbi:MAG: hypothetical protein AB1Z18_16130 [Desulfobacterales bacterium]|jgi:hypothetical protein